MCAKNEWDNLLIRNLNFVLRTPNSILVLGHFIDRTFRRQEILFDRTFYLVGHFIDRTFDLIGHLI